MKTTCILCTHSRPKAYPVGHSCVVGHECSLTGLRVYGDDRAERCVLFRMEEPPGGWQPEIRVELL